MQQAADDKNVQNIFKSNTPSEPYSSLIGASLNADKKKTDAVRLVPYAQGKELTTALKAKGVDVSLQTLPGSGHGGAAFGKPAVVVLTQDFFARFLKETDVQIECVPEADLAHEPAAPVARSLFPGGRVADCASDSRHSVCISAHGATPMGVL